MQLDLTRFRQPLSHVSQTFQPAEEVDGDGEAYRVVAPVELEFDLHKDKSRFRVVGQTRTTLELACSRCASRIGCRWTFLGPAVRAGRSRDG